MRLREYLVSTLRPSTVVSALVIGGLITGSLINGCERAKTAAELNPIHIEKIAGTDPMLHGVVARIDLTDPRVQIVICPGGPDPDGPGPWETILRTPSDIARANDLNLAINGGYFNHLTSSDDPTKYSAGDPALAMEIVMIDGKIVTKTQQGPALGFDDQRHGAIGSPAQLIAAGAKQIMGGACQLITDGKASVSVDSKPAPRTAVGLSADGKTLILMVVDGRRPNWSVGLTESGMADEMLRQGAFNAICLDGGGSSAMVTRASGGFYKLLTRPSDGSTLSIPLSVERPVPYVLGIRVNPLQ